MGEDIIHMSGDLFTLDYCDLLISNNIDKEEIITKINSEIANEEKEIERCEKMLNNPNFIAKAPAEKIEQEKAKLELHKANLANLKDKLSKVH